MIPDGKGPQQAGLSSVAKASNPWWWHMMGPKALGTILVNLSINSNLKPRPFSGNSKGS